MPRPYVVQTAVGCLLAATSSLPTACCTLLAACCYLLQVRVRRSCEVMLALLRIVARGGESRQAGPEAHCRPRRPLVPILHRHHKTPATLTMLMVLIILMNLTGGSSSGRNSAFGAVLNLQGLALAALGGEPRYAATRRQSRPIWPSCHPSGTFTNWILRPFDNGHVLRYDRIWLNRVLFAS